MVKCHLELQADLFVREAEGLLVIQQTIDHEVIGISWLFLCKDVV